MRNSSLAVPFGALLLIAVSGAAGCVPKPKQDYSNDQLKTLDSLDELMRVQAQTADPQFNKIGQAAYNDQEYAGMTEAAQRLQTTSEALKTKHSQNRPPSFVTYASRLNEQATELLSAAQAKDAARASTALTGIRDTCRTCHKEHR